MKELFRPSCSTRCALLALALASFATAAHGACAGDCDDNGTVTVGELVQAVNIALGNRDVADCLGADTDGDGEIAVAELITAVNSALAGCDPLTPVPTSSATPPLPTATPTPAGNADVPPTEAAALVAWLEAGRYLTWQAEGRHPGSGPHFGAVRTYVNDSLLGSLEAGAAQHPIDAAAVKELFGSGEEVRGWAVTVRIADGSGGGAWYWFEHYNDRTLASGIGLGGCTGCHSGGTDFVCTPFPLQAGGQMLPAQCP